MFAMRPVAAILLVLTSIMFICGCITQQSFPPTKAESVANVQQIDLDKDGVADLTIYDFTPVRNNNVTLKRQVIAVARQAANYSSFKNFTDLGLLEMRGKLDAFSSSERMALESCASNAGLKKDCTDTVSCSVLCSGSFKCSRVITKYQTAVAASMVDFVNERNILEGQLIDAQNTVLNLKGATPDQKNTYLQKILSIKTALASVYANPLYNRQEMLLCTLPDLDLTSLTSAAKGIGDFSPVEEYDYFVTLAVSNDSGEEQVGGVQLSDWVPADFIKSEEDIRSNHRISVTKNASSYVVAWKSERSSAAGYVFYYRFYSSENPERVAQSLYSPGISIDKVDLGALAPVDSLFGLMLISAGNFFIALGSALSITFILLLIIYNIVILLYSIARSRMSGGTTLAGVRQAFGRTELRWKTDAIIGLFLLGVGYYLSVFVATTEGTPVSLFAVLDYFTNLAFSAGAAAGLAGASCIFLGLILFYAAVENKMKVTVLERAYGVVIREEKDLFIAKVARLKDKITELQRLVDEYTIEEFDVSEEYDVLTSITVQRVAEISKEMTPESKKAIERNLTNIENAIERLAERKKLAAENWTKWAEIVEHSLAERNEVSLTSLITIPASMRPWVLSKYAKDHGAEGVMFERDSLKRKTMTPDMLIKSMIKDGMLMGAVLIQKDSVSVAQMAHGSATVPSVLTLKLRNYLKSLAKSLGQAEPSSFAAVGDNLVQVLLKDQGMEAMLLLKREKFKDAIEEWKKKIKLFSA
jgi:hypothetical protein